MTRWVRLVGLAALFPAMAWAVARTVPELGLAGIAPAVGAAIVARLLWGRLVLVAVAAGALLAQLWYWSYGFGDDALLAVSAVAHVWLGAWGVRRWVPRQMLLEDVREIGGFLVAVGPFASLMPAVLLSVPDALTADAGQAAVGGVLHWLAASCGATLGAAVCLVSLGRPRSAWRRRRASIVVPCTLALVAFAHVHGSHVRSRAAVVLRSAAQEAERIASEAIERSLRVGWVGAQGVAVADRQTAGWFEAALAAVTVDGVDAGGGLLIDVARDDAGARRWRCAVRSQSVDAGTVDALMASPHLAAIIGSCMQADPAQLWIPRAAELEGWRAWWVVARVPAAGGIVWGDAARTDGQVLIRAVMPTVAFEEDTGVDQLVLRPRGAEGGAAPGEWRWDGSDGLSSRAAGSQLGTTVWFETGRQRWALDVRCHDRGLASASLAMFACFYAVVMALCGLQLQLSGQASQMSRVARSHAEMLDIKSAELSFTNAELTETARHLVAVNQELQRRVEDLDQFAYFVGHDLQEPMRKLVSFSELLREDLGEDLPNAAADDLRYICDASLRLQGLVQRLLHLARLDSALELCEVQIGDCVSQSLLALEARIEESGGVVEVDGGQLCAQADATLVTQVLQNLIGNALKFRRPDTTPHVLVEITRTGDDIVAVKVHDNGIGVEPEDRDKVFDLARRGSRAGAYAGSGIGLAFCRKAVERLGGRLWVESSNRLGGACFAFEIGGAGQVLEKPWPLEILT